MLIRSSLITLLLSLTVLVCSVGSPGSAWAHSSGGMSGYSGSSGALCTDCHTASGTAPNVTLTGPSSLMAGTSGVYTFTITGGAAAVGGLDVSATNGILQATDPNTYILNNEVTHNDATPFTSGSLSFTFTLVAPASGTVTIYADGLSANNNGTKLGDNGAATTRVVTVTASAPQIIVTDSVAPTTDHQIPFGTVLDGLTSDQTVTVSNTGSADLTVGTISGPAAPFSIVSNNCTSPIAPGGSCTLTVRFAPTAAGPFNDTFDIPSDDTATGTVTMSVSGTGATPVPAIAVTDSVAPTTDHQIPFGTVLDDNTADQIVTVSNNGSADLTVGTIAGPAAPFSIVSNNCTSPISPGGSCTLTVRFAPTAAGLFSDSFGIPSDDPSTPTVTMSVSGTGTATPVPVIAVTDSVAPTTDHQIPFGNVVHGLTADQTVTVSNTGNASLTIGLIANANSLAAPFSITTDNCSGKTIAPGGSCTLKVRFAPTAAGLFNDTFDIPSNDPSTPAVTVSVSGTGVNNPPTAPTLVSPADGATGVGTATTLTWTRSTDPDNDPVAYHLYNCTDKTFATCTPVDVASNGMTGIYFAGSGLLFVGFVFARGGRTRKLILMPMIAMLLMTGALFTSCGNSGGVSSTPTTSTAITHQVSGLTSATTYYWKVEADDGKGGLASSPTWSFTTQ
jgi:hypothetical protein